jgi:deoxyribose-phosphate aldolase
VNPIQLAAHIQHTLYELGVSPSDLERHCRQCAEHGFNAAMVPARYVGSAVSLLAGTGIPVVTAVDFPLGLGTASGRVAEARTAVADGAEQLDLAVPVGLLLDGHSALFARSIAEVVEAVQPVPVKVMLELPLLGRVEAALAARIAVEAGAQWLKNASSGLVGPATVEDIALLRRLAPPSVRIKASGSIHTADQVVALVEAGADLVGTSSGVAIVAGRLADRSGY